MWHTPFYTAGIVPRTKDGRITITIITFIELATYESSIAHIAEIHKFKKIKFKIPFEKERNEKKIYILKSRFKSRIEDNKIKLMQRVNEKRYLKIFHE